MEFQLEPHNTAGTVFKITFPNSLDPTELAVTLLGTFFGTSS